MVAVTAPTPDTRLHRLAGADRGMGGCSSKPEGAAVESGEEEGLAVAPQPVASHASPAAGLELPQGIVYACDSCGSTIDAGVSVSRFVEYVLAGAGTRGVRLSSNPRSKRVATSKAQSKRPQSSRTMGGIAQETSVRKMHIFWRHFVLGLKMISLPRQARDKHSTRENSKGDVVSTWESRYSGHVDVIDRVQSLCKLGHGEFSVVLQLLHLLICEPPHSFAFAVRIHAQQRPVAVVYSAALRGPAVHLLSPVADSISGLSFSPAKIIAAILAATLAAILAATLAAILAANRIL